MDRVRLGRALGRGARAAAQTVYEAAAAATAPAPPAAATATHMPDRPVAERAGATKPAQLHTQPAPVAAPASQRDARPRRNAPAVRHTAGTYSAQRRGMLDPVKRASRAVSLQVSGSFFALFAVSFFAGAFRFHGSGPIEVRVWVCFAIAAMFAYFAVSNFLRARRLSRP